jgi:hypothetical protein
MAAIRAVAASSFDTSITLRRASTPTATGTYGERISAPATVTTLPARVATPSGPALTGLIERIGSVQFWTVTVAFDADVRVGDLIVWQGITMKVHEPLGPNSYSTANQFYCGRVN